MKKCTVLIRRSPSRGPTYT